MRCKLLDLLALDMRSQIRTWEPVGLLALPEPGESPAGAGTGQDNLFGLNNLDHKNSTLISWNFYEKLFPNRSNSLLRTPDRAMRLSHAETKSLARNGSALL